MDNLQWRFKARIVAFIDFISTAIEFLGFIIFIAVFPDWFIYDLIDSEDTSRVTVALVVFWIMAAITTVCIWIEFWADIMLLKATKLGFDQDVAWRFATNWRIISCVFLLVSGLFHFRSFSWIGLAVTIVFRGVLIFIVSKFIKELEVALKGAIKLPKSDFVLQSKV